MQILKALFLCLAAGLAAGQGNSPAIIPLIQSLQNVDDAITTSTNVVGGVGSNPLSLPAAIPNILASVADLTTAVAGVPFPGAGSLLDLPYADTQALCALLAQINRSQANLVTALQTLINRAPVVGAPLNTALSTAQSVVTGLSNAFLVGGLDCNAPPPTSTSSSITATTTTSSTSTDTTTTSSVMTTTTTTEPPTITSSSASTTTTSTDTTTISTDTSSTMTSAPATTSSDTLSTTSSSTPSSTTTSTTSSSSLSSASSSTLTIPTTTGAHPVSASSVISSIYTSLPTGPRCGRYRNRLA